MKWVRFGLVPLLVLALASMALAQATTDAKPAAAKSAAAGKSPEDMAKQALAKWKSVLKLTPEQEPQFTQVMTDSYQKMADAKTAAAGDKAKMKESMTTIMSDRDAALEKILTPDQMKIYHEKMTKMASEAHKHMSKTEKTTK
jgi:hypothetical protein